MTPTKKKTHYATITLSWIDEATGLPEHDYNGPPPRIMLADAKNQACCRFSNVLAVETTVCQDKIVEWKWMSESGYSGELSAFGIPVQQFDTIRSVERGDRSSITVRQTVGARTHSPEAFTREVVRKMLRPPAELENTLVELAMDAVRYPPIWTTLEATICASEPPRCRVVRHSLFPSMCYYPPWGISGPTASPIRMVGQAGKKINVDMPEIDLRQIGYVRTEDYDAVPNIGRWKSEGWGPMKDGSGPVGGNPWNYTEQNARADARIDDGQRTTDGTEQTIRKTLDTLLRLHHIAV